MPRGFRQRWPSSKADWPHCAISCAKSPRLGQQLPDVEIYAKAVRYALQYNEFFNPGEIAIADKLLARGNDLANLLARGEGLETGQKFETRTGRVHAYVSKIDGSIQPYRIVIPPAYDPASQRPRRLDFWCHGRGETLSELNFIAQNILRRVHAPRRLRGASLRSLLQRQ